jgi:endosialidase-like protein
MKMYYALLAGLLLSITPCLAQNVAINEDGSLPDASAILDIKSGNKGILIPRMSTADRELIVGPKGLMVYDTTTSSFWYIWLKTTNASGDPIAFWRNLATGAAWSLSGNPVDSTAFLGTTNDAALKIRVNNKRSGLINKYGNTFWGYQAGFSNPENGSTEYNTAIGNHALYANTGGNVNSAFGHGALSSNTEGHLNTAIGSHAMDNNTTGDYNTAVGYNAMYANTTGSFNTAIGDYATVGSANISNATAIGDHAWVNASNKIRLGNSAVTVIEGQVPFTTPSDGRFKFQVQEDVKGLDFILQLRPVTYQFDVKRFDAQLRPSGNSKEDVSGNDALQASYDEAARIRRSGFIAQEVEKAAMASGYNFSGIIQPKSAQEHYSLSYESFVVPLVKAVQEQQTIISAQQKKITEQQQANEAQNKKLTDLQQQLNELKQLMQRSK